MKEIFNIFGMQLFLLCLVLVGIIVAKLGIVDQHTRMSLNELLLNVFLPCTILNSFFNTDGSLLFSLLTILIISAGILALCFVLSKLLYIKADSRQKKVLLYATLISNAIFLGMPIVENIYGAGSPVYVSAYLLPSRIAVWTAGVAIFSSGKVSVKKMLLHPCMVATYLGLIVLFMRIKPPVLVYRLVSNLGNCNTPVAMLVVGNVLAAIDPRKIITKLTVYYTFIRLLLVPFLVMLILHFVRVDPMIMGISVILSGMPTGPTTAILADKYKVDSELACKIIFISTFLSIFTTPLLAWLLKFF